MKGSSLVVVFFFFLAVLGVRAQQDPAQQALSSIVELSVQKQDGTAQNGVGFLAVRDGMVATAWHIVRDAKRVVARFPSGDEFQCTGVIDKDETRNVALVRIKVFGRPLLKLSAADSPAGANLFVAGVKDTAFGLLPVTVAEPASKDGSKWAILNGDVPIGNSGAPLLNSEGEVVGLLTLRQIEGKVVPTMIPAGFILALDNSLPTEPWAQIPVSQPVPTPTPAKPEANAGNDAVDALLGNALLILSDNMDIIDWADVGIKGFGFRNGVPKPVYDFQQDLDIIGGKVAEIRTDDALRQKVIKSVLQALVFQKSSSENFIRSVVVGQQTGIWGAQAQDAFSRSSAFRKSLEEKLVEMNPEVAELERTSAKFRESLFPKLRYRLMLAKEPGGFRLGVLVYARRPFFMLVVYNDGFADKIGLRPGDTIKSVAGRDFTNVWDIEELKLLIKANLGKKIKAVVERDGKTQTIDLKLPKTIPAEAIVN
ncbi:MAG: trypsin-like peptidase domain-containing protein [Acidobacteria bacterium]|nr:trypsin-like peptidase domain-containing protein [Acidobacteriota bacterium]